MTSAAATANLRNRGNASVAPAPQLTNSADGPSDEQMEAMRAAEADAGEAERTLGTYEKKEGKIGRITQKKWFIVDPRSSKIVPYWDAVGIVRCSPACNCGCYHPGRRTLSLARGRSATSATSAMRPPRARAPSAAPGRGSSRRLGRPAHPARHQRLQASCAARARAAATAAAAAAPAAHPTPCLRFHPTTERPHFHCDCHLR